MRPMPRNSRRSTLAACALLLTTGCGGVHHKLRSDITAPRTIAVLPFAGAADAGTREATRALVHSRLVTRGYRVVETAWVDCVLTEHGWLRDPATFDPAAVPVTDLLAALGVDAVASGRDLDESRFNILVLRKHSFGGVLAVERQDGTWWSANHSAGAWGGFLLTSGQVFEELRAQGNHGTPMATLALIDEFVADTAATLPPRQAATDGEVEPAIGGLTVQRRTAVDGSQRLVLEGRATPGCTVQADLLPTILGVPMVAVPGEPGRYRGAHDVPAGMVFDTIAVRARTRFGREVKSEVKP